LNRDDDITSRYKGASAKRRRASSVYNDDDEYAYNSCTKSSDEYDD